MSTVVGNSGRLLTTEREARLAGDLLLRLKAPGAQLQSVAERESAEPVPSEVTELLGQVLAAVAEGRTVTISSIPTELTTSSAAALLGISRPTLMKLIKEGVIPAHTKGTHTRLQASDVFDALRERRNRERAAFAALLDLEGDEID